ncbi:MAG: SDR family oxidoreductase [Hyphomicrobiales bacterium]|nr:SDR family oxidoreductase [Hyphomicrobiales bacterium]
MTQSSVLVTGASRGIGKAVAERMAREGHHVIGLSRKAPAEFDGDYYEADLADPEATAAALRRIAANHTVLRLVNNSGVVEDTHPGEPKPEAFANHVAVNLRAYIDTVDAVLPAMRAAGFGRIVNIGSRAGQGRRGRYYYSMTKAGVDGLTRTAALELGPDGITVNCVAPGPVDTELYALNNPPGSPVRKDAAANAPMRRIGTPEDVAAAVAFFLSDEAGFTTGQTLYVCGGLSVAAPGM